MTRSESVLLVVLIVGALIAVALSVGHAYSSLIHYLSASLAVV